nr:transcription initiation factor TFIID subunit 4-like [Saimiri boliviensis boliviensis]
MTMGIKSRCNDDLTRKPSLDTPLSNVPHKSPFPRSPEAPLHAFRIFFARTLHPSRATRLNSANPLLPIATTPRRVRPGRVRSPAAGPDSRDSVPAGVPDPTQRAQQPPRGRTHLSPARRRRLPPALRPLRTPPAAHPAHPPRHGPCVTLRGHVTHARGWPPALPAAGPGSSSRGGVTRREGALGCNTLPQPNPRREAERTLRGEALPRGPTCRGKGVRRPRRKAQTPGNGLAHTTERRPLFLQKRAVRPPREGIPHNGKTGPADFRRTSLPSKKGPFHIRRGHWNMDIQQRKTREDTARGHL